ncbi:serine/threonine-protein kinase [Catenulispora subtropica]|uniref:non-specific serine/threonine protein kinase n=1 Tax=Catenulispora subtropica TaxID=450798 RepID=A0ABN2T0J6_9ACTN
MPEHSEPGRLVGGRYRLVARLGAGGMGRVWRAHDLTLNIDVAVKEVSLPFTLSEQQHAERLSRAEREARNTVRLRDQPGIVTVHDVVVEDGVPWIVMQLVTGRSLAEHVREHGPLSVENTAKVAETLLGALSAAHAAGIVHRDVKPANVLLADDGRVLLTDFGIAQHVSDSSLTVTGAIIGSAEYMAPERTRGQDSGPAGDLFSLGVTLYQAVEGVSPFRRDSPTATMSAVLFDQPPLPTRAGRLAPLLAGLLAKEPAQRPSVASALVLLGNEGATGSNREGIPPTRDLTESAPRPPQHPTVPPHQPSYLVVPPPRRSGLKVGLAVAAVVAVSAGATFAVTELMHSSGSSQTNPPVSSGPTGPTRPTGPTTAPSPPPTTPTSPDGVTTSTSPDSLTTTGPNDETTSTSPSTPTGAKAGCGEASRDLDAFNASNPAANGGKDFQIAADRKLADNLAADAKLATDPAVKTAIQSESDSWRKFADFYEKGDSQSMSKTIPETSKAIAAVNTACNG